MAARRLFVWICVASASTASAQVVVEDPPTLGDDPEVGCVEAVERADEPPPAPPEPRAVPELLGSSPSPPAPTGRSIGGLEEGLCLDVLRARGVAFHALPNEDVGGVGIPIRLDGELGGIEIRSRSGSELHEILDCRLAVALLAWAPTLRAEGVRRIVHYSTYRPGSHVGRSGRVSGHAKALAIDLAVLELADGRAVDVLSGWEARDRGAEPCAGEHEESEDSAKLRRIVCGAAAEDLFQVVLTPHYDRAHGNHVHLEVVPGVSWSFVH